MVIARCLQKFKNNTGKIYGYILQDINGNIKDVEAEDLKDAIKNNRINVVNLKLTDDGRLISIKEKQSSGLEMFRDINIQSNNKLVKIPENPYKDMLIEHIDSICNLIRHPFNIERLKKTKSL